MNPDLARLQAYPFERLRQLMAGVTPPSHLAPINLSVGEPKHPTPQLISDALIAALAGLGNYPVTSGSDELRQSIADWLKRRYGLKSLSAATQVLPVSGTREALFAIAQTVIDRSRPALVIAPNPFYQIYEGAATLAGARCLFLPTTQESGFRMHYEHVTPDEWRAVQLVYVCSPGNPTGAVMDLGEWKNLFDLADRHDFVIASDECYSEIYFDEAVPPLGALEAAQQLGRDRYDKLLVFGSLSKRSSAPGLRSGFVAGDAELIKQFFLYRTYHGTAMSLPTQAASIAAWRDEAHVIENRRLYAAKFEYATPVVGATLPTSKPAAAFYLWAQTPLDDAQYARALYAATNVTVLPGSYMARDVLGQKNPGAGHVRIALVAEPSQVVEAADRIAAFQL